VRLYKLYRMDAEEPPPEFEDEYDGEMTWEEKAREGIEDAMAEIKFDEVRGSIYLMSARDHRWNSVEEEFRDAEKLRTRLTEIGEGEWIS
jgi:hypothetical protein